MITFIFIVISFICGVFAGYGFAPGNQCPRKILGYNCKGEDCDHSNAAIVSAKKALESSDDFWDES